MSDAATSSYVIDTDKVKLELTRLGELVGRYKFNLLPHEEHQETVSEFKGRERILKATQHMEDKASFFKFSPTMPLADENND